MALRSRQMRNYMLALMLSQGTPMIVMGETDAGSNM
jgi:pullulanase/glycogen debranching enzyme